MKNQSNRKIDIIYNITRVCPWDCAICCVDALHVKKKNNSLIIRSESLSKEEIYPRLSEEENIYEKATNILINNKEELSLEQKKQVIDNLEGFNVKIDISGGDALINPQNIELLKYASNKLGKENVTLTATGLGIAKYDIKMLASLVGEYNFTFDAEDIDDVANRPNAYAIGNLKIGEQFHKLNCSTRAELPLTTDIINRAHLVRLYKKLHERGIDKLLIMRLFPVGRGMLLKEKIPSIEQYKLAIEVLLEQESKYGSPQIKLQCALKHLFPQFNKHPGENPCDLVSNSFGITPNGTLLASPWAYNASGKPLGEEWVLGNLSNQTLSEIFDSQKYKIMLSKVNENVGHCRIFSFFNSQKSLPIERIFDSADPLYNNL